MNNINSKLLLNIKVENTDSISKINTISVDISLSLDEFVLPFINKIISDIKLIKSQKLLDSTKLTNK